MTATRLDHERARISKTIRDLREQRHWTQAKLSKRLGLSQSRLSELERGQGSFTAEQFLAILRLFNVSVTHFSPARRTSSEIQNALARLGATHLVESEDVLPSDRLEEAAQLVREVLVAAESPRQITALAPVLVRNIDRLNLKKLEAQFVEIGLEHRLAWLIANTLEAVRIELERGLPRKWALPYRRAELILNGYTQQPSRSRRRSAAPRRARREGSNAGLDILDSDILSTKTLEEVQAASSPISRHCGIASGLQPSDFVDALRAARVAD